MRAASEPPCRRLESSDAMTIHDRYSLTKVINARGTFTPLGVSRSSARVGRTVAEALQDYVVIDELQELASRRIADFAGSEAGTVTHCTAAGITLSIAATMTGTSQGRIAALPDTEGMPDRVVLPGEPCGRLRPSDPAGHSPRRRHARFSQAPSTHARSLTSNTSSTTPTAAACFWFPRGSRRAGRSIWL